MSFDEVVVSFNLLKQKGFNYGQIYVALSRVTSLAGLFLTGNYNLKAIKADPRAHEEYERMRNECLIEPLPVADFNSRGSLTITLLNTRSLQRHAIDIAHEQRLLDTDILCLTETQLMPDHNTNNIDNTLHHFQFLHNKCNDKFQSISIGYTHLVEIFQYQPSLGMSLIEFGSAVPVNSMKLLVVYRKNNSSLGSFYNRLSEILLDENIDIVFGDFNINANPLFQEFHQYDQIVQSPTHLAGATLDLVYVRNEFMEQFNLLDYVINIYFSDHIII